MTDEKPVEGMSIEECDREIEETLSNFDHPYWGERGPAQKRAVERMRLLHEKRWPSKGAGSHEGLADRLEREGVTSVEDIEEIAAEKKTGNDEDELELSPEEKEALDGLKHEWGENYEANIEIAKGAWQGALATVGDSELNAGMEDLINETGIGNNPIALKWFHKLAEKIKEGVGE